MLKRTCCRLVEPLCDAKVPVGGEGAFTGGAGFAPLANGGTARDPSDGPGGGGGSTPETPDGGCA